MRIYDISMGVQPGMPVWPGDPPVTLERSESIADGGHANVSRIACSVHVGTHAEPPIHFAEAARAAAPPRPGADVLDARVLDAAGIPPRTRRVLFRTRNSTQWARGERSFRKDYIAVAPSGAEWLVRKGVHLVGVDYLSVAPFNKTEETHRILLGAGVVVVEGLYLADVKQGRYTLYCLPLKLIGSDGAPARAIPVGVC